MREDAVLVRLQDHNPPNALPRRMVRTACDAAPEVRGKHARTS